MNRRAKAAALVSLEDVSVRRGRPLLRRVSWRLREGELWAIVGPNGAGKSTLLRVLRGETPASGGEIEYSFPRGLSRRSSPDPREEILQVSFDAQSRLLEGAAGYAQSRWHSGEDEAASRGRDLLGGAPRSVRGRRLVDALGLARLLDRRVTELSNGERRKLVLARAASRGPSVLVLDNPFSGLDGRSRRTLSTSVRRLHRAGTSVVLVTAREDEILAEVTHLLFLDRGRVVASGPRAEVLAHERFRSVMRPIAAPATRARRPPRSRAGPRGDPVVELRGVGLRHDGNRVLSGVDWTVRSGERWVVLGPNGAGKSALLSLVLADNPQAYANEVALFGRRRGSGDTIWEIRRRIGCVSPELHLYHARGNTAVEVVGSGFHDSIGLYRRSSPDELRRATTWLRRLGIARCLQRRFGELSEGEQQLVLLARALVKEPELLVLDEPCQGLDAAHRRRFLERLQSYLERRDGTLIYVTHDLGEVPSSVTHGLVLRRGRKVLHGPAGRVLASYRDRRGGSVRPSRERDRPPGDR